LIWATAELAAEALGQPARARRGDDPGLVKLSDLVTGKSGLAQHFGVVLTDPRRLKAKSGPPAGGAPLDPRDLAKTETARGF